MHPKIIAAAHHFHAPWRAMDFQHTTVGRWRGFVNRRQQGVAA
jgi:hypothetical protein